MTLGGYYKDAEVYVMGGRQADRHGVLKGYAEGMLARALTRQLTIIVKADTQLNALAVCSAHATVTAITAAHILVLNVWDGKVGHVHLSSAM